MAEKQSQDEDLTVAVAGDRRYVTSRVVPFFTVFEVGPEDARRLIEASVTVEVVDGRPAFQQIDLRTHAQPLTPHEVQRLPWGRLAEGALENAARAGEQRSPREVYDLRRKGRRSEGGDAAGGRYQSVTDDRLTQLSELRSEAQAKGLRWDTYAADKLGYSPGYLRRLAGKARP